MGSGREISIGDLAQKILSMMGHQAKVLKDDQRIRPEKSEVERLVCDNSKARKLVGWEPHVSLEEGLRRTIDWFESHASEYRKSHAI